MDAPPVQYARTEDGVNIAYFCLGEGPPVVFASNIFGDATTYRLDAPRQREFPDHLVAANFRPILMDIRGMGGSDRHVEDVSLDARIRDVEAVTVRLGLSRFALCGFDSGAVTAIAYAVKHPDQVSYLLLFMPWRSWRQKFTAVVGTQAISAMSPQSEEEWKVWAKVVGSIATGFEDTGAANKMAAAVHQASSAAQRAIYMRATQAVDISDILPLVQTRTLVLHAFGPLSDYDVSRDVATRIKNAEFVVINHPHTLPTVLEFLRTNPTAGPASREHETTAGLSAREIEVLRLLAQGKSNPEISKELFITRNTVQNHVSSILIKTNLNNRAQAAVYAKDHGLA